MLKIETMPSHSTFSYELFPQLSAISLVCCSLSIVWHYIVGLKNIINSYLFNNAKRNISYLGVFINTCKHGISIISSEIVSVSPKIPHGMLI